MNHARFYTNRFRLHGLINFNYCFFQGNVDFFVLIYKSKYEPVPTTENVRSFKSVVAKRPIKFYKSQFHFLDTGVEFWVHEGARELIFIDCEIYINVLRIIPDGDNMTLFSLQFHRTVLSTPLSSGPLLPLNFVIYMMNENLFIFINMSSVTLSNVALQGRFVQGYLGVCIENVTWINRETFMDFDNVVSVNIVSSQLILNCDTCPAMIIDGLECSIELLVRHFCIGITGEWCWSYSKVSITETTFKIHVSMPYKIATENTNIFLKNSTFIIEGSVSFKAKEEFKVANSLIQCPTGEMPQRALSLSHVIYTCKPTCEGNNK